MIHDTRVSVLNPQPENSAGDHVLLWVQASVRTQDNHALEYAVQEANRLKRPLVAVFGLTPGYPEANARHYLYLLEGLRDLRAGLRERGIPLRVALGDPVAEVKEAARAAVLVVTDLGYLRLQRQWRDELAAALEVPLEPRELERRTTHWAPGEAVDDPAALAARLPIDQNVGAGHETGGEAAALARLAEFVAHDLAHYHERRGDPTIDGSSRLSAYLHYGHLSPLTVALAALEHPGPGTDALLEELVVRRELSFNFCWYNPDYDRYEGVPDWARRTLEEHGDDPRPARYTPEQLNRGETADPYWNAAQRQMVRTGRMHNYMRMYWGKKLLEWSGTPREAHATMLALNNRYEQDGRDANSFVGVSWVLGLHDRPWARHPIFGTVRSMSASGLRRKFDMEAYVKAWGG